MSGHFQCPCEREVFDEFRLAIVRLPAESDEVMDERNGPDASADEEGDDEACWCKEKKVIPSFPECARDGEVPEKTGSTHE